MAGFLLTEALMLLLAMASYASEGESSRASGRGGMVAVALVLDHRPAVASSRRQDQQRHLSIADGKKNPYGDDDDDSVSDSRGSSGGDSGEAGSKDPAKRGDSSPYGTSSSSSSGSGSSGGASRYGVGNSGSDSSSGGGSGGGEGGSSPAPASAPKPAPTPSSPSSSSSYSSSNATSTGDNATSTSSDVDVAASSGHGSKKSGNGTDAPVLWDDDAEPSITQWTITNNTKFYDANDRNNKTHSLLPPEEKQPDQWPLIALGIFLGLAVLLCLGTCVRRYKSRRSRRNQYEEIQNLVV